MGAARDLFLVLVGAALATAPAAAALETIVVTAQKKEERLQDVPIAVTAVTGETLEREQINLVKDVAALTPGLNISRKMHKMGLRTSPMAEVIFEDCRVPVAQRLGREGRGVEVFECSMEWERGCILASCLGVMRRQLEDCIRHARQRKQFGRPIGKNQSVANRIVDMKIRLETCRSLVHRIGELKDKDQPAMLEAAMAKLHVCRRSCSRVRAIMIFGATVHTSKEWRDLRDAVAVAPPRANLEHTLNPSSQALSLPPRVEDPPPPPTMRRRK